MAGLGFFGANLEGYGCAGMSNVEYGLDHAGAGTRRFRRAQLRLGARRAGHVSHSTLTARRSRSRSGCRALQSGKAVGCFGLTEPDFGSNPAGMRTTARREGDGLDPERREDLDHQRLAWPTSRWSGRAPTMASAASWWSAARPASPPRIFTASGPCARRSPPACRSRIAACRECHHAARRPGTEGPARAAFRRRATASAGA